MASRPWDSYPTWKKILLAPLVPFHGVAPKKITIYGALFSMIGSMVWGSVFVLDPLANCMQEEGAVDRSEEEIAQEAMKNKNITAFEYKRENCLVIERCLGEADSTLGDMMFEESMEDCEPYLADPH